MFIAVSIYLCLSAVSWAADPQSRFLEVRFEDIDADKNGSLSLDEFINTPLGVIKKNDVQKLVLQKLPAKSTKNGTVFLKLTADEKRTLFESIDKDKNGSVSNTEWVFFKDGKFKFKKN
jgi:hypothetical protein